LTGRAVFWQFAAAFDHGLIAGAGVSVEGGSGVVGAVAALVGPMRRAQVSPQDAGALAYVPAVTFLVGDPDRSAWLALTDGQVTALVAGDSGLTSGISLAAYQRMIQADTVVPAPTYDSGLLSSILVLVAGLLVVAVGLVLYEFRRRSGMSDADELVEPDDVEPPLENEAGQADAAAKPTSKPKPKTKPQAAPAADVDGASPDA
jgi:hypothetical protein